MKKFEISDCNNNWIDLLDISDIELTITANLDPIEHLSSVKFLFPDGMSYEVKDITINYKDCSIDKIS